jgi:hypothetical protein
MADVMPVLDAFEAVRIAGVGIDARAAGEPTAQFGASEMGRKGESATRWAFQNTYKRAPTPDELAAYEWALHLERLREFPDHWLTDEDRADLASSDPGEAKRIFARLTNSSGTARQPKKPVTSKARPPAPMPERRGRPPKVTQARALLRQQLADGPRPGTEIEAAAQAAEIPKRELLAAADTLDVRTQREQWWFPVEPT